MAHVYNPLTYAWAPHAAYLARFGNAPKKIMFLGMNPGPFGMMQTGVPFGEVAAVRGWMGIEAPVEAPADQHPKRLIDGFACRRSEVSGRRLWGWAEKRFGSADDFFAQNIVINYCPLVFLEATGRNRTPAQLPATEQRALEAPCDRHLARVIEVLTPEWLIGIGGFAEKRLHHVVSEVLDDRPLARRLKIGHILHPARPARPPTAAGTRRRTASWRTMACCPECRPEAGCPHRAGTCAPSARPYPGVSPEPLPPVTRPHGCSSLACAPHTRVASPRQTLAGY